MPPLLELENVTKTFGTHHALGPLDLTVPEGSVGLLGPNGAGKTTLIRLILGLLPPTTGTIRVLGEEVRPGHASAVRRVGYAPEGESLFPGLTGAEAVAYGGELVGMKRVDSIKRAHEVLDYAQMGEERYRLVESYSTGMKQRLKLAQSLVHDPELLILDEPTEGVDPQARLHLLKLIKTLSDEHGIKVIVSTHILPDVEELAKQILVLNQGKVATQGMLAQLKRQASRGGHFVRVAGDVAAFTGHLTQAGVRWSQADNQLRVDLDDPRDVLRHVIASGSTVRHLAPVTMSLEEVFEKAVQPATGGAPHA